MEATWTLASRAETLDWGARLGQQLEPGDVIALIGDLGAGKTTLTQGIAQGLGIRAAVTSPTFALIQEYPGRVPLFHCDPYRLDAPEEVLGFGFEEYFERGGVVVVEWADKVAALLPPERLTLTLTLAECPSSTDFDADQPRRLTAQATGARYTTLLQAIANRP